MDSYSRLIWRPTLVKKHFWEELDVCGKVWAMETSSCDHIDAH